MVSVITVVYNAQNVIRKTIESVLNQKGIDLEYLVIDGKSSDSTMDIVNQYKDKIANIVSEKDSGIYDAMNKGISLAKGDWIYFLNAGDVFFNNTVLFDLLEKTKNNCDIIYGEVAFLDGVTRKSPIIFNRYSVLLGSMICHQAILAKKNTFIDNTFSLEYKIISDRIWLHKALNFGCKISHCKVTVSYYDMSGISLDIPKLDTELARFFKNQGRIWSFIFFIRKHLFRKLKRILFRR